MLEAAVSLILSKGAEKTTLKEVGEKAGYSRGLAGYRFGSKSGLFAFTMQKLGNYWLHYLKDETTDKIGIAAINSATDVHQKVLSEYFDNVRVFYILWFEALRDDDELKSIVSNINKRRHEDVAAWIKSDETLRDKHAQADDIASMYNTASNGIAYEYLLAPKDGKKLEKMHENLKYFMSTVLKV